MSLPEKTQPQSQDSFLNIASSLQNLSQLMNMPAKKALEDRSVNIPSAAQKRDGCKSTASKKRKSDSNENEIDLDDGTADSTVPKPNKKAKKDESATRKGNAQQKGAGSKSKQGAAGDNDVSSIHLDGDERDSVPVYDTCDDIRTKINRFLRETPGASNAGFTRTINAALPQSTGVKATAAQLGRFLKKHGPTDGAESPVFYASYVFFEKLRIKWEKPKSKKREEMESVWGPQGMGLHDLGNRSFICHQSERPYVTKFGELKFARR
ncbi:uncharacterized protein Z519_07862 [Cladophialophora bantiana CBS 173.52]|uniref:DUF7726 domain-containing protein n=1 Tax=Cladophialophora bantiana (strain ATCC 10958 / CBS 173.52 / CDC B-1940 / NIH 8579) TaxID=1442370 RepID=A0A0D2FZJ6_CLAB1|nr:uncharacterized protein Z519_07862 [Cladophialophora bantiana CBS 173.52]KIW91892.1 hypothetical protein Z519_07862 [Cladophialophora bantiana CBS 173.52]